MGGGEQVTIRQRLEAKVRERAEVKWIEIPKHWALRLQKPLRLIKDGEVGGGGRDLDLYTYSLHCHHQTDSALRWAAV